MLPVSIATPSGRPLLAPWRVWTARILAVAADAVQLGFFPLFGQGAVSPLDDALDVAVAVALTLLVGWHWSFLPAFGMELIPMVDLAPTWTGAALLATRGRIKRASEPTVDAAKS
jgi:hypothetical protein